MKQIKQTFRIRTLDPSVSEQFLKILTVKQLLRLRNLRIFLAIQNYEAQGCFDEPGVYMLIIKRYCDYELYRTKEHAH